MSLCNLISLPNCLDFVCGMLFLFYDLAVFCCNFAYGQEKELSERHNVWLNDELTAKVNSLIELRRKNAEFEADVSAKLAQVSVSEL